MPDVYKSPLEKYMELMGQQNHSYDPSIDQPKAYDNPFIPPVERYMDLLNPIQNAGMQMTGLMPPEAPQDVQAPVETPIDTPVQPQVDAPLAPVAPQVPVQAPYDPEQGIQQAYDLQKLGAMGSAQVQGAGEAQKAKAYQDLVIAQDNIEKKRIADEALRQEAIKKSEGEYVKAIDEYKGKEVDPERFWKSKGPWAQVLGAISVGLSQFGESMQGRGGNPALDIIERAIDRDIDSQKAEIDKLGNAANMRNNLLSNMRARFSDERQAEQATRAALLDSVKSKLDLIGAKTSSADVKNKLLMMAGELDAKKADAMAKFGESVAKAKELQNKEKELMVPGYGKALDVDSAKKARDIVGNANAVSSAIQQLKQIREEYGAEFLNRSAVRKGETAKTALELSLKEAMKLGTLDKGSEAYLQKLVADPTGIGFNSASLDELDRTIKSRTSNQLAPLGIEYSAEPDVTYTTKKPMQTPDGRTIPAGTVMKKVDGGWTPIR